MNKYITDDGNQQVGIADFSSFESHENPKITPSVPVGTVYASSNIVIKIDRSNERAAMAAKFSLRDNGFDNHEYLTEQYYFVFLKSDGKDFRPSKLWLDLKPFLAIDTIDVSPLPPQARLIDNSINPAIDNEIQSFTAEKYRRLCRDLVQFGIVDDTPHEDIARNGVANDPRQLMIHHVNEYGLCVCPTSLGAYKNGKGFYKSKTDRKWDSTSDPTELKQVLKGKQPTGFAINVGESGFAVVDLDTIEGGHTGNGLAAWVDKFDEDEETLPDAPIVQSPSGGLHIYYEAVPGLKASASVIGSGIDVKAGAAVVLGPLSSRPDLKSRYRHLPEHGFDRAPAKWPPRVLFEALFHNRREQLAKIGINNHRDLDGIDYHNWHSYVEDLIVKEGAESRARLDETRAKKIHGLSQHQASSLRNLGQVELDNIVNRLYEVADVAGQSRNTMLHASALKVGHLLADDTTGPNLDESSATTALIKATAHWTDHNEASRTATIKSGISGGREQANVEVIKWLTEKKDKCLGLIDRQTDKVGDNVRERVSVSEARELVSSKIDQFWASAEDFYKLKNPTGLSEKIEQAAKLETAVRSRLTKTKNKLAASEQKLAVLLSFNDSENRAGDADPLAQARLDSINQLREEIPRLHSKIEGLRTDLDIAWRAHRKAQISTFAFPAYDQIKMDTGGGKSEIIIQKLAAEIDFLHSLGDDGQVIYFAPTLALAAEIETRLHKAGVSVDDVKVYRGRLAADPTSPEGERHQACLQPYAASQIGGHGAGVAETLCKTCPLASKCYYMSQAKMKPCIWITAHAMLPLGISEILPEKPFALFIDEDSTGEHVKPARRKRETKKLKRPNGESVEVISPDPDRLLAEQINTPPPATIYYPNWLQKSPDFPRVDEDTTKALKLYRNMLRDAVHAAKDGYLTAQHLIDAGFEIVPDHDGVFEPLRCEQQAKSSSDSIVVEGEGLLGGQWLDQSLSQNYSGHAHSWLKVWKAVNLLLQGNCDDEYVPIFDAEERWVGQALIAEASGPVTPEGLIWVSELGDVTLGVVKSLPDIFSDTPILAVDATPSDTQFTQYFSRAATFERTADVSIETPHQSVVAVLGASTSKTSLTQSGKDLLRSIGMSLANDMAKNGIDPSKALVVTHMSAKEKIEQFLPGGVALRHFGGIRGLDSFSDFEALYIIGAPLLDMKDCSAWVETLKGSRAGGEAVRVDRVLQMRCGTSHVVQCWSHTDEVVARQVADVCINEMIQAVGRLRGVNRTNDNPCRVVIMADVVLPLEYDQIVEWSDFAADPMEVAENTGIVPTTSGGAVFLYPWISSNKNFWNEPLSAYFEGRDLFRSRSVKPLYKTYNKGMPYRDLKRIRAIIPQDGGTPVRVFVDEKIADQAIALRIFKLNGQIVKIQGQRSDTLNVLMDKHGFISMSKTHCHQIAPDLFLTVERARRDLEDVEPEDGEIVIKYKAAGRGQKPTQAIVRANTYEDAEKIIRAAFKDCAITR